MSLIERLREAQAFAEAVNPSDTLCGEAAEALEAAERSAVIEECAKVCDSMAEKLSLEAYRVSVSESSIVSRRRSATQDCAAAIRALHTQGKPNEQR